MSRIAVLGAGGGIGRVLVDELLSRGHTVVALDLPRSLDALDGSMTRIPLDVHDDDSMDAAAHLLTTDEEPLHGMVNLIGYTHPVAPLSETPIDLFDDTIAANLRGVFRTTSALLPCMAEGGSVVLVASGLAQFVRPGFGPYAAAKAGVIAMAKTYALESAPRLRVNVVAPGPVRTAFLTGGTGRGGSGDALVDVDRMAEAIPMGRIAEPPDVTGPVRFLLGQDSAFMTGQVLWINGGAYMP